MDTKKSTLDPWRILLGHLMDIDNYSIPSIIDKTGMVVDWTLTERENYSHKWRRDALRPRIIAAYNALPSNDKLRVSHTIAAELSQYKLAEDLCSDLKKIGWIIENDSLIPVDAEVTELFFPKSTKHDAYVKIREILQESSTSIYVIDPWIDSSIFIGLRTIPHTPIKVKLLTANYPPDFIHEIQTFISQYTDYSVELRKTNEFHDRFLVIDEAKCWHIGASIKDAGNKAFMISLIEDDGNRDALIKQIEKSWYNSQEERI